MKKTVEEMIKRHLLKAEDIDIFNDIMDFENEKCLYLVDGLDEWIVPKSIRSTVDFLGIPNREFDCTTMFTTRPWKMTEIWRRPTYSNMELRIVGFDHNLAKLLVNKVFERIENPKSSPLQVVEEMKKDENAWIKECPLLLKFATCVSCNNETFHKSITDLYCDILDWNLTESCKDIVKAKRI